MNWDAQSDRAAIRYYSDWCPDGIQEAHRRGARWQREALLSDETVERAARVLNAAGWTCKGGWHEPGEYDDCGDCERVCNDLALVVLTAAIGDDDE